MPDNDTDRAVRAGDLELWGRCGYCGKPYQIRRVVPPHKYCSDICRVNAWRQRDDDNGEVA